MSKSSATLKPEAFDGSCDDVVSDFSNTPEPRMSVAALKEQALQTVDEWKSAAEAKARELRAVAEEKTAELREKASAAFTEAKTKAQSVQKEAEAYVRENPLKAVAIAAGAGFILGLLARRS